MSCVHVRSAWSTMSTLRGTATASLQPPPRRGQQQQAQHHQDQQQQLRSSPQLLLTLSLMCLLTSVGVAVGQGLIAGSATPCDKEGEEVVIPGITDDPCISCTCRNLQVECEKAKCVKLEGCHAILFGLPHDRCCELCKGCKLNGMVYSSGDNWTDTKDPCKRLYCRAGVITETWEQCLSHCHSPLPVQGQCCPACPGCRFRGKDYKEGTRFPLPHDVCSECTCQNGSVSCSKRACPVLNCPASVIYQPKGECCPRCRGMRRIFDVPSRCYFAKQVYRRGEVFHPDACTSCRCMSGTSLCTRVSCPVVDCPPEERTRSQDGCCETCPARRYCTFQNTRHAHTEEWQPSPCLKCACDNGVTYCQRERCTNSLWCPKGYQLRLDRNACCPNCVERDAVCTVFGDPHYRTFDGRLYNFQGGCKYLLAHDCGNNAFTIKARNGVRFSTGFTWTQMLSVLVGGVRVSLLQNLRVKVEGRRVSLPFVRPGVFHIRRKGKSVRLRANLGFEVVWDGDSFLEVTVAAKFKGTMCGLCGNYNGLQSDDLTGRDGRLYLSGEDFGATWRTGSRRTCLSRPDLDIGTLCQRDARALQRASRVCNAFYQQSFLQCRSLVPVEPYVSSCVTDMCDCPEGRYCACESFKAYHSQCQRAGLDIALGRQAKCQSTIECPAGAKAVLCADTCPSTCRSVNSIAPCPDACATGCLCTSGLVLHDNACIPADECPRS